MSGRVLSKGCGPVEGREDRAGSCRNPNERTSELRDNLSAYDALYLALAETLLDPILLTSDVGLAAHAVRTLGDRAVRHLR